MERQQAQIQYHYQELLKLVGKEALHDGTRETPKRAAKAFQFLTSGYHIDIKKILNGATFTSNNDNMVIVKNIEFYSLCEHHLLPFYGQAHVGYLPNGKVIGLSKIPRIVDMYSRRLQIQENLCEQISHELNNAINSKGVGVIIEATHTCMCMRGVQKQSASMVASSMIGDFKENVATRNEFLKLIEGR